MARRIMVSDQFLQFDNPGVTYTGLFQRRPDITYEDRPVQQYALLNDRARLVFNGTLNLNSALEDVKDGEFIEILYEGAEDLGEGRSVKKFSVWVVEADDDDEVAENKGS